MSTILSALQDPSRLLKKVKNPKTYSIKEGAHRQYIDKDKLKKAAAREKENRPPEHSQTMRADLSKALKAANMGGRKTRKRRKRRRKKNKKKRTKKRARKGGVMEKNEADAYRKLIHELQMLDPEEDNIYNPSKLLELQKVIDGSDLVKAQTKHGWRCTGCGYTDQKPNQTYCRKCNEDMPCNAYSRKEDQNECYRHGERKIFYEKQQAHWKKSRRGGRKKRRKKNKKKRTKKRARRRKRRSTKKGKGLFPGKTRKY